MRLFVAIELDERVRARLRQVQEGLRRASEGVRWIPAEQLHITARFLGEVSDGDVPMITEAVSRAATGAEPFEMTLAGAGCFPPRGGVRIVWVGIDEPTGTLLKCVEVLNRELEEVGFPRERRPFSPHITIGRVREDRSGGRIRAGVEPFTFEQVEQSVRSFTLMQSVLSPKGPTYTPLSRPALGSTG